MKTKKPKIVVVSVGDAVSQLVDNLSHEMSTHENVEFVKVQFGSDNKNPKAKVIQLSSILPQIMSPEKIFQYLENPKYKPHLEKILSVMKPDDELYEMVDKGSCFFTCYGFRALRDGKTLIQLDFKEA